MPTVFEIFGMRFFFFANEHQPIHIHVVKGDENAKIAIEPQIAVVYNKGLKPKDLKRAVELTTMYRDDIIEKWHEFHG
ncbi:MAG: DUF4160 domain-containing protein [Rikenellaceae bacterium]